MNKRTSLMISFVGDPYIAVVFHKLYKAVWRDEVDEVLILVNGVKQEIVDFIGNLWAGDDKVMTIRTDEVIDQGQAFNRLYKFVTGDVLLTLDSDSFVFNKGFIKDQANKIRAGNFDVIGTSGNHASSNLAPLLKEKYGTCRINPWMSFWGYKILKKIGSVNFRAKWYEDGEKPDFLSAPIKGRSKVDHMGELFIKAKELGAKIEFLDHKSNDWRHFGGISAASRIFIKDPKTNSPIDSRQPYKERDFTNLKLLGLWYIFYKMAFDQVPFSEYNNTYFQGLKEIIDRVGTNEEAVHGTSVKYRNIFNGIIK